MSFLSVSSKKTRVHLSPESLSSITSESCYNNQQSESDLVSFSDIAPLPIYKSFLQVFKSSKESWLNICKIKQDSNKEIIQLCVKNKVENVCAIAASKKKGPGLCFASGYTNGQVKIRDLQTNKLVKEFSTSKSSSVFFLDFNSSDEYLASVHEDGLINIYGMQTSVKLQSLTLDNQSSLARFHPQKRSILGVASYSGKVSIIDTFAKKTIFKADAHSAPCSDIAMTEDFLLTSGYDSLIKIFDLRKKSPGIQIQSSYGWTSIACSKCGVYLVGGNMKGELISYDMRYIKKTLSSARVENSNHKISRVAFLSTEDDVISSVDLTKIIRQSLCKVEQEVDVETNDNFFEDMLGFQRGRISDFSSNIVSNVTRASAVSRRSSIDMRFGDVYGKNMVEIQKEFSSPVLSTLDDSHVNKSKRRTSKGGKFRGSSIGAALEEVNEECNDKENDEKELNCLDAPIMTLLAGPRFSSTPTISVTNPPKDSIEKKSNEDVEIIEIEGDESFKSIQDTNIPKNARSNEATISVNFDFRQEFDALAEKIHIEVGSMNLDQNMRYIEIMSHVSEQRRQLSSRIQTIEESLAILLNDDYKINLINDLQSENRQLRQEINKLTTRRSSH